jgi:hypothetical protein
MAAWMPASTVMGKLPPIFTAITILPLPWPCSRMASWSLPGMPRVAATAILPWHATTQMAAWIRLSMVMAGSAPISMATSLMLMPSPYSRMARLLWLV